MSFFPRLSYLSLYGGELHRKGGVLLKARLGEWERELQYLRFRIAEWKEFGSIEHPDYLPFRAFLLQKVRDHLLFELKTLSSILVACEVAVRSDDVPPLRNYADSIFAFRERISSGEITRRIHVEEWQRYCYTKEAAMDTPSQMDDMFTRIRNEIGAMERRSKEFKSMVDELVRMVDDMQERERIGGFANGLARGPRVPASRSSLVHSSSVLPTTPMLADSRARLPPRPPVASRSPLRQIQHSHSHSHPLHREAASELPAAAPLRAPPPPRPAQNPHRRLFNRASYVPRSSGASLSRTPSPSRMPPPPNTPEAAAASSSHDRDSQQARPTIAETRTRLPPPPQTSPVPYRPPGQRLLSFFGRP
ncbi:hypothetical protein BJV78DRAFT_707346 [Lactifluus subvellereus]|nr:hypothetical protein BJV78DRAFT_707346 [Lactifluus subvellereus]